MERPRQEPPRIALPPLWPVVGNAAEAAASHREWEFHLGVTASGPATVRPWRAPHLLCVGATGSGKTTAIKAWLEQFRAAGWQVIVCDGIGIDYSGYAAPDHTGLLPPAGIGAVGRSPGAMGYVGAIILAHRTLMDRAYTAAADRETLTPVLLVMDEIKTGRATWKSVFSGDERDIIESMVTEILALGRELRVHVLLVSQDVRAASIPGTWKSSTETTVFMGRPSELTMKYGAPAPAEQALRRAADDLDTRVKGRGLVCTTNGTTGASEVTAFQAYYSLPPGEQWDRPHLPPEVRQNWSEFKDSVSDAIPRLYSRRWFRIEEKSRAQLAAEDQGGEALGFIDFDMFSVDETAAMPLVDLDAYGADGTFTPDPAMAPFDPNSSQYVCRPPSQEPPV